MAADVPNTGTAVRGAGPGADVPPPPVSPPPDAPPSDAPPERRKDRRVGAMRGGERRASDGRAGERRIGDRRSAGTPLVERRQRPRPALPQVSLACTVLAGLIALVSVLGWLVGASSLVRFSPGLGEITFDAALLLAVLAVGCLRFVPARVALVCGGVTVALSVLILIEYVAGVRLGIDWFSGSEPAGAAHPGRPSVSTSVCLVLLGLALVLRSAGRTRWAQVSALVAVVIAALTLLGYAYDVRVLYAVRPSSQVSLQSAVCVLLLGVAVLASVQGGGLGWAVRGTDPGAVLVRRLLPVAVIGLPVVGYLCLLALRHDVLQASGATALIVVLCAVSVGALTWIVALQVARSDGRRARTVRELAALRDSLEEQVEERATQLQVRSNELAVLEDRQRIAADLHDIVIQRLFAAGMFLQGGEYEDEDMRQRVGTAVESMDIAIKDLRTSIFELGGGRVAVPVDITSAIDEVCLESARVLGYTPELVVDDPDRMAEQVRGDLLAVLREALANVARHAHATAVTVMLRSTGPMVTLLVTDNGVGMGDPTHSSGTRNVRQRAVAHGGQADWLPVKPSGTQLVWWVPVDLSD